MQTHNFEKLVVWQKSMDLVTEVYSITKLFPKDELYGLTSQMRRAVISVPSNIAEGCRRRTTKDFNHFLTISFGSGAELETQLQISKRLGYLPQSQYSPISSQLQEVMRMLNGLISSLPTTD